MTDQGFDSVEAHDVARDDAATAEADQVLTCTDCGEEFGEDDHHMIRTESGLCQGCYNHEQGLCSCGEPLYAEEATMCGGCSADAWDDHRYEAGLDNL